MSRGSAQTTDSPEPGATAARTLPPARRDRRAGLVARFCDKPAYFYRPRQLYRRTRLVFASPPRSGTLVVDLPWGACIDCRPDDPIGRSLEREAVYDLVVTEALFRLADPGEVAIDAGANIGYMSSVLATAVGPEGRVIAIEPDLSILPVLRRNADRWAADPAIADIELKDVGISSRETTAMLATEARHDQDRSGAAIVSSLVPDAGATAQTVRLMRLDRLVPDDRPVGVLRLNVGGHEAEAVEGAGDLVRRRRIRDVVLGEHGAYPTRATRTLERFGYEVFGVTRAFRGPRPTRPDSRRRHGAPATLVATVAPARLLHRLEARGWRSLGRAAR